METLPLKGPRLLIWHWILYTGKITHTKILKIWKITTIHDKSKTDQYLKDTYKYDSKYRTTATSMEGGRQKESDNDPPSSTLYK